MVLRCIWRTRKQGVPIGDRLEELAVGRFQGYDHAAHYVTVEDLELSGLII